MPPVWSKLQTVDNVTRYTVNGWIRDVCQIYEIKDIPRLINSICILYYHNDEIWKLCSHPTGEYYQISADKKEVELFQYESHSIYGINHIFLDPNNTNKFKWDIEICNATYLQNHSWMNTDGIISVGLTSDANHCFLYESDGTKIDMDQTRHYDATACQVTMYGDEFGQNDIISIHLNLQTQKISFSLNQVDQGVAYSIEQFNIKYLQLFLKAFAYELRVRIIDFYCYK